MAEIVVVPFPHPGHIFPAIELSRRLADRNIKVTILLPSTSSPDTLSLHPLITALEFPLLHPTRLPPGHLEQTFPLLLTQLLTTHPQPKCLIIDEMINWLFDTTANLGVPAVAFFTSSAYCEANHHPDTPPRGNGHHARGGGRHGGRGHHDGPRRPRGVAGATAAAALLFNTCEDIERRSIVKIAADVGKPVWGVGPLLPAKLWAGGKGSADARPRSIVSEPEVLAWLDARPRGSVIYVSFGTLVVPTNEELAELAAGLAESGRPFIWVVQAEAKRHSPTGELLNGSNDDDSITDLAGAKGMIIKGWAPQMLILGHPSVGGFVCHCGWNSTVEALACGVPVLAWPVRGDQFPNAELVTDRLGAGCAVKMGEGEAVTRADVAEGIEKVLSDEGIKKGAAAARQIFSGGFPKSSAAALDAFVEFVTADARQN